MDISRQTTPNKHNRSARTSPKLDHILLVNKTKHQLKSSLFWGGCNSCLLGILIYDILHTSPIHFNSILYIEYALSIIFFLNLLYHFTRCFVLSRNNSCEKAKVPEEEPPINVEAETLTFNFLSFSSKSPFQYEKTPTKSLSSTPINNSAVSWLSNTSPLNTSGAKSFTSSFTSPNSPNNSSIFNTYESSGSEFIRDEQSLVDYLKGYETCEKNANTSCQSEQPVNLMATFWTHPSSKTMEVSYLLKNCNYQLSPPVAALKSPAQFDTTNNTKNRVGVEMWRHLHVSSNVLTEWNANIRMWLSQTILERLCKQFDQIDGDLQKQGYTDVQIGYVGLEHLRKTSQMAPVLQYIPSLSILIPFLEISSNQEYLVKRIKELGKGGCMSNFKWNSGANFNGKEWNNSLPTDSEIIMHLFATYMDNQLPLVPNRPDMKPFSDSHYIKLKQEIPSSTKIAIQQCSEKPPHFCVVVGNEVFQMVQGYNNLFHTLLFFLYQVNEKEYGMLGGINLGKSGINILWVINQ
ncbi:hypothetical protein RN001_000516 [Aquatica leii]|uniref:Transmembrane protein 209 n=1 Tax=Aquatica leii TaxID=1421715 RepID=A0AAN7PA35_9COLE|nr:hypothetical protein RN001_000516 [Aquatica leii]